MFIHGYMGGWMDKLSAKRRLIMNEDGQKPHAPGSKSWEAQAHQHGYTDDHAA